MVIFYIFLSLTLISWKIWVEENCQIAKVKPGILSILQTNWWNRQELNRLARKQTSTWHSFWKMTHQRMVSLLLLSYWMILNELLRHQVFCPKWTPWYSLIFLTQVLKLNYYYSLYTVALVQRRSTMKSYTLSIQ